MQQDGTFREVGLVGLGRMGANMATRLLRAGHRVVGYDREPAAIERAVQGGSVGADSLPAVALKLRSPRVIWLMVPAGDPVDQTIRDLLPSLAASDVIVDGGNSDYRDTVRRAAELARERIQLVDVGTSGGIWGLTDGFCLMIGGDPLVVDRLAPIFEALAPAADRGWGHVGPVGAGHFVKMVHNGIEYGLMQAYAEGLAILKRKTEFGLDLQQIAEIWREGSVVRSWLLDRIEHALARDPELADVAPLVADSGEGRWTVREAIDLDVPAPVITLALLARLRSRDSTSYADRLLAALRHEFGGHPLPRSSASQP